MRSAVSGLIGEELQRRLCFLEAVEIVIARALDLDAGDDRQRDRHVAHAFALAPRCDRDFIDISDLDRRSVADRLFDGGVERRRFNRRVLRRSGGGERGG